MTPDDAAALNNVLAHADEPTRKKLLKEVAIVESHVARMNALPFGSELEVLQSEYINERLAVHDDYLAELAQRNKQQSGE